MRLVGILNEDPFSPSSWSGTAPFFFGALQARNVLRAALDVSLNEPSETLHRVRNIAYPMQRWRTRYRLDTRRFEALTRNAGRLLRGLPDFDAVLQIGAWYSAGSVTTRPCYSYHDGNFAVWYRQSPLAKWVSPRLRERVMAWEKSVYEKLDGIFVMSAWLGDSFMKDFGVPSKKIHVVGAGINLDDVPAGESELARSGPPRFLFVGRDFARKGGHELLAAFRLVKQRIPEATLTIVGPELADVPDGVTCAGFLNKANPQDRRRLQELYATATVYVMPSLFEPFGIAFLEAMAHELPCIASNRCAMPEIVLDGKTGLIVDPENPASIADAMVSLALDPRREEMGRAGKKHLERFTWANVTRTMIETIGQSSHA